MACVFHSLLWFFGCGDGATVLPPDPPRPTTVTITPGTTALASLGAMARLTAEVRDQNGQGMAGTVVAWFSSDTNVATIDASGTVTAVSNGAAAMTATAGAATGTATVTVMQVPSVVVVSPAVNRMIVIDTLRLTAESRDANGHAIVGSVFSWTSTDGSVASVDSSGFVTALSAGEADVTAASGGVTGQAEVVVSAREPTSVLVVPEAIDLLTEDTVRLTAEVRDQRHRVMEGRSVSWSSADAVVAAVDSEGVVTAVNSGATTVFARAGAASAGTSRITVSLRHPSCTATSHPGDRDGRFKNDLVAWRILNPASWIQRRMERSRVDPRYTHPVELIRISAAGTARVQICSKVPVYAEWQRKDRNRNGLDFTLLDTLGTVKQGTETYSMIFDVGHLGPEDHEKRAMIHGRGGSLSNTVPSVYRGGLLTIREDGGLYDVLETIYVNIFQDPHRVEFSGWEGQPDNLDLWAYISIYDALGVIWTGEADVFSEPPSTEQSVAVMRARDADYRDSRDLYHPIFPSGPSRGVAIDGKRFSIKNTASRAHWRNLHDIKNDQRYLTWDNIPVLWRDHLERIDPDNTPNKSAWLCLQHPGQSPGLARSRTADVLNDNWDVDSGVYWGECYDAQDLVLTTQRCWDSLGDTSEDLEEECRLAGRGAFMKFDIPEPPIYR